MKSRTAALAVGVAILVMIHLYLAFLWSPPEASMGNLVRIMYFHVASAWIAFLAFTVTSLFGVLYLIRRNLTFDTIAAASAELGVVYTSVTLITGSLWARPVWNTWWTWDPRLTTTLILWFLYLAYLLLRGSVTGLHARARVSAIYAIIAFVDVPIIHMSVTWWRSIHPTTINETGFHMPGSMAFTLMFGFVSFLGIYLLLLALRVRQERQRSQLLALGEELRRRWAAGQ